MWGYVFCASGIGWQVVFFLLAVVAAIYLIPKMLQRSQKKREKQLAKNLLRKWCSNCMASIMRLKPSTHNAMTIDGYPDMHELKLTTQILKDVIEGRKSTDGIAGRLNRALERTLYSDEEFAWKEPPPEVKFSFFGGDPAVPRSWIRQTLNGMYAKSEIFELDRLPIQELELAMSILDTFSQWGYMKRDEFISMTMHLAQSFEKFAKYLWLLEDWADTGRETGERVQT